MAVWFTRTGDAAPGKLEDALRWAVKVTEHVNKAVADTKVEVLNNIAGRNDQMHWIMRVESLAQFEKITAALDRDEKYQALIADATKAALFTKIVDNLYRVIG